jgi:uncharacterized membrane protein
MATDSPAKVPSRFKMHWHVILTHFPLSFFGAAFGFQILHLITAPYCFELATNAALIGGAISMVPVTWTGWRSWKSYYRGAKTVIFRRKICIAFTLLGVSAILSVWRSVFLGLFTEVVVNPSHWIYLAGNTLLIVGAFFEGYYGGRLNHH